MSERVYEDVDDVRFIGSVTNIHSAGDDRVQRFRQAKEQRFVCYEERGWLHFVSLRRSIRVPRSYVAHMEHVSPERSKELGPNPVMAVLEPGEAKQQQKGNGR